MDLRTLLVETTDAAYTGDEMSLLCGVFARKWVPPDDLVPDLEHNLTEEAARARPATWRRSILQILKHVADCKVMYMTQAFGPPPCALPPPDDTLASTLAYLDAAHGYLAGCLERLDGEALARPVPTQCHGSSAANLFRVLAQHDIYHGSQIQVLREATGVRA